MYRTIRAGMIAGLCAVLASCAAPDTLVNVDDATHAQSNEGYLLTSFETNTLYTIDLNVPRVVSKDNKGCMLYAPLATQKTFHIGEMTGVNLAQKKPRLVKMVAGTYSIAYGAINKSAYKMLIFSRNTDYIFDIKPGTITYIGDIRYTFNEPNFRTEILDDEFHTIEQARAKYPHTFAANKLEKKLVTPFNSKCADWQGGVK